MPLPALLPLIGGALTALAPTLAGAVAPKIINSISAKVGKKKAQKIADRAITLYSKKNRNAKEEKELKSILLQYPQLGTQLNEINKQLQPTPAKTTSAATAKTPTPQSAQQVLNQVGQPEIPGAAEPQGPAQIQGTPEGGYPAQEVRFQRFSPEQQAAQLIALQSAIGGLGQTPLDFGPIEEQARAGFSQKTVPSIAERFTQLGNSGQRSSAFSQSLGEAGKDLERELAALRSQYNLQKHGQLANLLGIGLTPQYSSTWFAGQPGSGGNQNNWQSQLGNDLTSYLANPETRQAIKDWWNSRKAVQDQSNQSNEEVPVPNIGQNNLVDPTTGKINQYNLINTLYPAQPNPTKNLAATLANKGSTPQVMKALYGLGDQSDNSLGLANTFMSRNNPIYQPKAKSVGNVPDLGSTFMARSNPLNQPKAKSMGNAPDLGSTFMANPNMLFGPKSNGQQVNLADTFMANPNGMNALNMLYGM